MTLRRARPLGREREPAERVGAAGALAQGEVRRGEGGLAQHAPLDRVPGVAEVAGRRGPTVHQGRGGPAHRRRRQVGHDPGKDRARVAMGGGGELGQERAVARRPLSQAQQVEAVLAGADAHAPDPGQEVDRPDGRAADAPHRQALVERGKGRAPAVHRQLGDAGLGGRAVRPVLDEVDRGRVGQDHECVGEPLPEAPLAERPDERSGGGPELLQEPAFVAGAGARGDEPDPSADGEDREIAVGDRPRRRSRPGR